MKRKWILLLAFGCLFFLKDVFADPICKFDNSAKSQVCFFALNGPEESQKVTQQVDGLCSHCLSEEGAPIKCTEDSSLTKIKEFYACQGDEEVELGAGGNVSKAFEEMTKERCDGLIISGHHVGYYTGGKTYQEENTDGSPSRERTKDKDTLSLDFLEKLSCLKTNDGTNCQPWFSNIKYVHLHGSYTAGRDIGSQKLDDVVLDKIDKYSGRNWNTGKIRYLNREYASTVDEKNPLSSRYNKMFPGALLFGWSAQVPTIDQGSPEQILKHMKTLDRIISGDSTADLNLDSFLKFLASEKDSSGDPVCDPDKWNAQGGGLGELFEDDPDKEEDGQKGCDLSNAINMKDTEGIKQALENIFSCEELQSKENCAENSSSYQLGTCSSACHKRLLAQNINRIFALLNDDNSLSSTEEDEILEFLKKSPKGQFLKHILKDFVEKEKSIVRRADYVYLFKKIFGEEDKTGLRSIEKTFMEGVNELYDHLETSEDSSYKKMYKEILAEVIWKNNIGQTLKMDDAPDEDKKLVTTLLENFAGGDGSQALLLRAAIFPDGREDIPAVDELIKDPRQNKWIDDWMGLQIKNKKYENLSKIVNDDAVNFDKYKTLMIRIAEASLIFCMKENPFVDQLRPGEDKAQEFKDIFNIEKDIYTGNFDNAKHCGQ